MTFLGTVDIQALFQIIAVVVGAAMVVIQLRNGQRLGKAQYIADVNGRLAGFNDCMDLLFGLSENGDFERLSKSQQERILDYFTVFEVLEALRRHKVLKTADVSYYFGGRLGDLTSNSGVRNAILFGPAGEVLAPIFALHRAVLKYRMKRAPKADVLNSLGDLESIDPALYRARANKVLL